MEDINPIELLKEEMDTDEIHLKVNVIHRLKTIILSIGPDDTVKKLIPYLESKHALRSHNTLQPSSRKKTTKSFSPLPKSSETFGSFSTTKPSFCPC